MLKNKNIIALKTREFISDRQRKRDGWKSLGRKKGGIILTEESDDDKNHLINGQLDMVDELQDLEQMLDDIIVDTGPCMNNNDRDDLISQDSFDYMNEVEDVFTELAIKRVA